MSENIFFAVSVVVRTSGRDPIFIKRALESICVQTVRPEQIIVVDDGASASLVAAELSTFDLRGIGLLYLSRDDIAQPLPNRAVALNKGINSATTEWIAFLDDDDTWSPNFLERVTGVIALTQQSCVSFGGVVTQTEAIFEFFDGEALVERRREPFNRSLQYLDIAALAVETQFTINSLVIRKFVYAAVGGYREDLAVQEDWEFHVRAAVGFHFEVIPEALVYYHLRPSDKVGQNTSANELDRVATMIRNEWIRKDIAAGRLGLGQLCLAGESRGFSRELSRWVRWRKKIYSWLGRRSE